MTKGWRGALIALAAGAISATAFAPLGLWPLMPLALIVLVWLLEPVTKWKRAAVLGWMFGIHTCIQGHGFSAQKSL